MANDYKICKYVPASNLKALGNKFTLKTPPHKLWDFTSLAVLYEGPASIVAVLRIMVSPTDLFSQTHTNILELTVYPDETPRELTDSSKKTDSFTEILVIQKELFDYQQPNCPCKQTFRIHTPFPVHARMYENGPIPRTIVQTSRSSLTNYKLFSACMSFVDHNPEFDYVFMDDDDVSCFVKENCAGPATDTFEALVPGAYKADLFRYMYLYKNGGFYFDCKMICKAPIADMFFGAGDKIVFCKDRPFQSLYNAVLFAEPNHKLIASAITESFKRITIYCNAKENPRSENTCLCKYGVYGLTGPKLLWDVAASFLKKSQPQLLFSNSTGRIHRRTKSHMVYLSNPMHWLREKHDSRAVLIPWYPDYYSDYSKIYNKKPYKQLFFEKMILQK